MRVLSNDMYFSFLSFCFFYYYYYKDGFSANTVQVGKALAGQWFDVEEYFNEFQKQLKSTGDLNRIE